MIEPITRGALEKAIAAGEVTVVETLERAEVARR